MEVLPIVSGPQEDPKEPQVVEAGLRTQTHGHSPTITPYIYIHIATYGQQLKVTYITVNMQAHPISSIKAMYLWTNDTTTYTSPVSSPPSGASATHYLTSSPAPLSERFLAMMSTNTFRSLVYRRPAVERSEKRSMHSLVIESGTRGSFRATGSSARLTSSISFSPKLFRLGLSRRDSRRRLRLGSEYKNHIDGYINICE